MLNPEYDTDWQHHLDTESAEYWSLIDMIYEAGQHPEHWPVLLNGLSHYLRLQPDMGSQAGAIEQFDIPPLLQHFERALQLNKHVAHVNEQQASTRHILDSLPVCLAFLDGTGRCIYLNQHARRQLGHFGLVEQAGYLLPKDASEHPGFLAILAQVADKTEPAQTRHQTYCLRTGETTTVQRFRLFPLADDSDRHGSSYVVLSAFHSTQTLDVQTTAHLYGLSQAETRLLTDLIHHASLEEIARHQGISRNTVKTQLRSIYQKTGTNRQAGLIRLLLWGTGLMPGISGEIPAIAQPPAQHTNNTANTLSLRDGRQLGYAEYGNHNGQPVLHIHNLIGSRLQVPPDHSYLTHANIRLIMPDRPGIGLSSARVDGSLQDWCEDIGELAEYLKLDRFAVVGSSLGAVYALALARFLPRRVSRIAVISTLPEIRKLSCAKALPKSSQQLFAMARYTPFLLKPLIELMSRKGTEPYLDKLLCDLPEQDRALYRDPALHRMCVDACRETLVQGTGAFVSDTRLMANPWPFELEHIQQPVSVWHGDKDVNAPLSLMQPLFARLPNARVNILPEETHWMMYRHWHTILAHLAGEP